ncbi:hypothetical protein DFH09DRAFT_1336280 [Mycena vulgaris]|nr:hypothetical protein DFH09DRAFT_1336280 [Mycena vulgaris]
MADAPQSPPLPQEPVPLSSTPSEDNLPSPTPPDDMADAGRPAYNESKILADKSSPWKKLAISIFEDIKHVQFPALYEWENNKEEPVDAAGKTKRNAERKTYILDVIWPALDTKFAISGPDGFKVGDFHISLVKTMNNMMRVAREKGVEHRAVVPARQPRKKNAKDIFKAEHSATINAAAKATLEGKERKPRDGLALSAFNHIAEEMYENQDADAKAALAAKAAAVNAELKKDPTEEDIAKNQEDLPEMIQKVLRRLMGVGPQQAGDVCFFVRYAYNPPGNAPVVFKRLTVLKPRDARRYTDADMEDGAVFKAWARDILSPNEAPEFVPQIPVAPEPEQPIEPSSSAEGEKTPPMDFSPELVKAAALAATGGTGGNPTAAPSAPGETLAANGAPAPPANGAPPAPPANGAPPPPPPNGGPAPAAANSAPPPPPANGTPPPPPPNGAPPPPPPNGGPAPAAANSAPPPPPANGAPPPPPPNGGPAPAAANSAPPPPPANGAPPPPPNGAPPPAPPNGGPAPPAANGGPPPARKVGRPKKAPGTANDDEGSAPKKAKKTTPIKRKAVEAPAGSAAKKQKQAPTPAPVASGRASRSRAAPKSPPPSPQPGRMIKGYFYPVDGPPLPTGFSWDDDYEELTKPSTSVLASIMMITTT